MVATRSQSSSVIVVVYDWSLMMCRMVGMGGGGRLPDSGLRIQSLALKILSSKSIRYFGHLNQPEGVLLIVT